MIPQTQRWWRGAVLDDDGEQTDLGGDCFAACIASILELPYSDDFPNFLDSRPYGEGGWFVKWQEWLYDEYRHEAIYYDEAACADIDVTTQFAWWIACVMVGDVPHCVVFNRAEFRHDPSPYPRVWSLADVTTAVALFSVGSIYDRIDGRYESPDLLHRARTEAFYREATA